MKTSIISKLFSVRLAIVAAGLMIAGQAGAQTTIYDNGPINGTINNWLINSNTPTSGLAVSDSFTVSSAATLTSAQAGLWVPNHGSPVTLIWEIGTTPFSSNISSGMAFLDNTFYGSTTNNSVSFSVYESAFDISGSVTPGTYYLTLTNALATVVRGKVGWDQNNGPSSYYATVGGSPSSIAGSESFQIFGTPTPEPSAAALLPVLAGVGVIWRQLRKKA